MLLVLTNRLLSHLLLVHLKLLIVLLGALELLTYILLTAHHFNLVIYLIVLLLLSKELIDALEKTDGLSLALSISIGIALTNCKNLLRLRSHDVLLHNTL